MNADEIRTALETAVGVPELALREAVAQSGELAPAVIAAARRMADGRLPLPREEKLLRFGLHAMAAARETSVCPAFLAMLRRGAYEVQWLLGEDRANIAARLLLGLYDGDDAAVCALATEPEVDDEVVAALLRALARLAWEGRADRGRVLEILDRFDRERLAPDDSWAWFGWQEAIMLLGLADWIPRVEQGWAAGRMGGTWREVDRKDWIEQTRAAAEHPEDPKRFIDDHLTPIDDPVADIGWSADPFGGAGVRPSEDELAWLDVALMRSIKTNLCLEEADGLLTAFAAGPVRVPVSEYVPLILRGEDDGAGLDSADHKATAADLLKRHHDAIERELAAGNTHRPWLIGLEGNLHGALWARGYIQGIALRKDEWEPMARSRHLAATLVAPVFVLLPGSERSGKPELSWEQRRQLTGTLPDIVLATKLFWLNQWHPLHDAPPQRTAKVGRNEPCPCGSGKKYKRCCGAAA
jgi:yecA family protein